MLKVAALLVALAVAAPAPALAQAPQPVAKLDPGGTITFATMPIRDPFMVPDKATGLYHLFARNNASLTGVEGVGTMVYTSKDLITWSKPRIVFLAPKTNVWFNDGNWAPEVHQWQGKWYLSTTMFNESIKLPRTRPPNIPFLRATILAVSDKLDGPYTLVRNGENVPPADRMSLDGTIYADKSGKPWMVYAREHRELQEGTIEAVPLNDDLSPSGLPIHLFKATDALWPSNELRNNPAATSVAYVTDGPQFYRTKTGELIMLWSSYSLTGYAQSQARSKNGDITGPWEQLPPLLTNMSGHGMLFTSFEGQLMMIVHRGAKEARANVYDMRDLGDRVEIVRRRTDIDLNAVMP